MERFILKEFQPVNRKGHKMEYPITMEIDYPGKLSRLTTFFLVFMVIPQLVVLYFIGIATGVVVFIAWLAFVFTGRYPGWAFDFINGYFRWYFRVIGYNYLLTDKYPLFSME